MSLWMLIVLLGLLKLPMAALMLWIPYRNDQALKDIAGASDADEPDASEDDGGSVALPASPLNPHPQSPRPNPRRRGPHGSDAPPPSPSRIRRPVVAATGRTGIVPARAHRH